MTVTLREVSCGPEVNITQEGLPDAIPPEHCYLGWQESLDLLAKMVEPESPTVLDRSCLLRRSLSVAPAESEAWLGSVP